MKLLIASDLHLEFWPNGGVECVERLAENECDAFVCAGDLSDFEHLSASLHLLCDAFDRVVYVAGNHEHYGSSITETRAALVAYGGAFGRRLTVLDNSTVDFYGQRFVGGTLWFRDDPGNLLYEYAMTDFRLIEGFRKYVYAENSDCVRVLSGIEPGDIVVTHHLPSRQSVSPRHQRSELNRFFVTELGYLIKETRPRLWIHGHTHDSCDYLIGETRVVCNPYGYHGREVNPDFDWEKVVEV